MRKLMMGLSLVVAAQASAQTSSTALPAAPVQTTTATLTEAAPAPKKKWSVSYTNDASTVIQAQKDQGRKASVSSLNIATFKYNLTDKDSVAVAHQFYYNDIPEKGERNASFVASTQGYASADPFVRYYRKFDKVAWAKKVTGSIRYIAPTSVDSRNRRSNGTIRASMELPYTINKWVDVSWFVDPRLTNLATSDDVLVDFRQYGNLYVNINDNVQPYLTAGTLTNYASLVEGRKTRDRVLTEVGVNLTANKNLSFALLVSSLTNASKGSANTAGRIFAAETTEFGLGTYLNF
ncbi:MAG: hypothetical protein ACK5P6_12875 [Pseudobdellovibrionaceae bacterium]